MSTTPAPSSPTGLRRALRVLLLPITLPWRLLRALLTSFRFWALLLFALFVVMVVYYAVADRHTPLTTDAYIQAYVVQIAPQVAGQVMRVAVREGETVQAGQLLFEVDRRPFEHRQAQLVARQTLVRQQVSQLSTSLGAARAEQTRLKAEADLAELIRRQEESIFRQDATTERRFAQATQRARASQAAVEKATEEVRHAQESLDARVGNTHAQIAQVRAELAAVLLDLEYTRVIAPCEGVITDLQLREGAYVHVGQPAMTLIDTRQMVVVANLREPSLEHLAEGMPALVALHVQPGRLHAAHVVSIGWGIQHGQGVPSGRLPEIRRSAAWVPPPQRFQVRLQLDETPEVPLRVGLTGSVSIYTDEEHWLYDITRAYHQCIAWLYFL
ncbi:MAG: HlyD family secretion protein [Gemmataceae bacterium]